LSDSKELIEWVHDYVAEASRDENVDAFVTAVDAAIVAELPELGEDAVLLADLHASTRSQFQVFLSLLEREKQELLLPPQAVDLALSIARRQLELGVLLKVYRIAAGSVWEWFTQVAASVPDDGPDRTAVLVYLWDHGGTWINEAIEQLIGVFYAERETAMHGAVARRTETVRSMLRGDAVSIDHASTALGHPVRGTHIAFVLWADDGGSPEVVVQLNRYAAAVASALGVPVLTIPAGGREVWCWVTSSKHLGVGAVTAAITDLAMEGARASVGNSAPDIAGFRQSHREAVDAQRHATVVDSGAVVTGYADVELACLMAGNELAARVLIDRELGALASADENLDRVRETVATFLHFGGNVEQTAQELIVHKNTVRYRLTQAEELIGHPLSERRTSIALALAALPRFS